MRECPAQIEFSRPKHKIVKTAKLSLVGECCNQIFSVKNLAKPELFWIFRKPVSLRSILCMQGFPYPVSEPITRFYGVSVEGNTDPGSEIM
jgi:hypothetical protein